MAKDSQEERLNAALELMLRIGSGDLSAQAETSSRDDQVDAIVTGLNMLAEDLAAETEARQRAEELLRDERDAYENAPGLFCSLDASNLEIIKCNRSLASALGRAKEDLIGRSVLELCEPDDQGGFRELLSTIVEGGKDLATAEVRLRTAEGVLLANLSATQAEDIRLDKRVRIIFQDITKQRLAEASLGESQQRLESLFKSSPDFLLLVDQDHKIEMINRVEGAWTREQILGMPLMKLFAPEDCEPTRLCLERVFHDREREQWDARHVRADGTTRHFNSIASPVIVADVVTRCVVALRDTSAQILLQKEKSELEEQMRQTQKMDAVGRLAGGVAHDFNNILTAIMGYTSLAQFELEAGDPRREWADEISKAASRAADLTRQLLAFSRRQVVAPKVIDLSELTQNLLPMLARLIGETINLRTETEANLQGVLVDPGQAEQIVLNLVINARDAMDEGGEVLVETSALHLDADYCRSRPNAKPGKHIMLAVSDTGCGMSPEVRERIFEPFFTTKEQGSGTGLGLATVFGIVQQAGGWVEVYSEAGMGSSFKVYFPCASGDIETLASRPTAAPTGGHETVLLVEDEEMVRELAVGLLRRLGYDVLSAADGTEALRVCEAHKGPIEILVTDVVMPGMNGRELARKLSEPLPNLRVLFTSGYPQDIITHQGVLEEGVQFLPKPYTLDSLAYQVRKLIDRD